MKSYDGYICSFGINFVVYSILANSSDMYDNESLSCNNENANKEEGEDENRGSNEMTMRVIFFVGALGDTDLIKATLTYLQTADHEATSQIILVPFTPAAVERTLEYENHASILRLPLSRLLDTQDILTATTMTPAQLDRLANFVEDQRLAQACIGVPSNNNEIPFQIALHLALPQPTIIVNEYMFQPVDHCFWRYVPRLAARQYLFAVPLAAARQAILTVCANANVQLTGHLSIDHALAVATLDVKTVKQALAIDAEKEDYVFVSGTTQPFAVESQFLESLLSELAHTDYAQLQVRLGLHPGIDNADAYLHMLLDTCSQYALTSRQFKIILTPQFANKLLQAVPASPFLIVADIPGAIAAQAAAKVTQAVPGALLNEAAIQGKPCYFDRSSATPYLPQTWFSSSLSAFFQARPQPPHTRAELGLDRPAPAALAQLLNR